MGTSRSASSPKKVGVHDKMMVIRVTKLYQYDQPSFDSLLLSLISTIFWFLRSRKSSVEYDSQINCPLAN